MYVLWWFIWSLNLGLREGLSKERKKTKKKLSCKKGFNKQLFDTYPFAFTFLTLFTLSNLKFLHPFPLSPLPFFYLLLQLANVWISPHFNSLAFQSFFPQLLPCWVSPFFWFVPFHFCSISIHYITLLYVTLFSGFFHFSHTLIKIPSFPSKFLPNTCCNSLSLFVFFFWFLYFLWIFPTGSSP